jgi:pyruvate formate lyase activating enzyme
MSSRRMSFRRNNAVDGKGKDTKRQDGRTTLSRRDFLTGVSICGLGICAAGLPLSACAEPIGTAEYNEQVGYPELGYMLPKESPFYTPLGDGTIMCLLCPRGCIVAEGRRGYCEVRENRKGKYYSLVWGNPCAIHVDPIEKKPFFHVLPGTTSYSIATAGCNLTCKFCQNYDISQARPENTENYRLWPAALVREAKSLRSASVAYTYVEPTIFFEYMLDCAKAVKEAGLLNVMHSNGYINPGPRARLAKYMAAANIDLKGFTEDYYSTMTEGRLAPVLDSIKGYKKAGVHVEITTLIVPTGNDDIRTITKMCEWIRDEVGKETPIHFSRFTPMYKLTNLPSTPVESLEAAHAAAKGIGLEYVYIGNVPGHRYESTYCPKCGEMLIFRLGYFVGEVKIKKDKCAFCGYPIAGIWEAPRGG